MPGVVDGIMAGGDSEGSKVLEILFGKNTSDYQKLKMVSEIPPSLEHTFSLLGLVQRRYKSSVLKLFDEEFLTRQKSRDRQGIGELIEVWLGRRGLETRPGEE